MAAPDAAQVADGVRPEDLKLARFDPVWNADIAPAALKLVLVAMTWHANQDGTNMYMSVATIAKYTSLSLNSVRVHIKKLREHGVIVKTRQATWQYGDTYALNFAALAGLQPTGALNDDLYGSGIQPTGALNTRRAPVHKFQGSSRRASGLQPTGDNPVITGVTDPVITGGKAPTGSGLAPVPSGAWPGQVDIALVEKWERRCRWTVAERVELYERAKELDALGHDLNALVTQALERGWREWPRPPKPARTKSAQVGNALGSRAGESYVSKNYLEKP